MNIPTPADPVMEMARECAAKQFLGRKYGALRESIRSGERDELPYVQSALAAIRATTEAAASLIGDKEIELRIRVDEMARLNSPEKRKAVFREQANALLWAADRLRANKHIKGSDDAENRT